MNVVPPSIPRREVEPGARRRLIVLIAALVALTGVTVLVVVDRGDEAAVGTDARAPAAAGWTRLPDPPISPRVGASAAWTGAEILVVGGWEFLCPPGADCVGPTEAPFTDGAAFDPSTGTWRRISDAPAAFEGVRPAIVDGAAFFLVDCSTGFTGIDGGPAEGRCPDSDEATVLLRFEPVSDSWTQLPGPPNARHHSIEAAGDSVIAYATTEEHGEEQDWRLDLSSETWHELPDDPLPPMYDRSIVSADQGNSLLLFGAETGPSSEPSRSVNLAARLDLQTLTWTELPPSPSRGFRAWAVNDHVVLEPHFGATGGRFDPARATWSSLPVAGSPDFDSNHVAGAYDSTDAVFVDASGWVFDLDADRWLEIEPIDDRSVFPLSSVTAVGRDLFVFGGQRWTSPDGELLGDAWMWTAPG